MCAEFGDVPCWGVGGCACVLIRKTQAYAQTLNAKAHAPNGNGFCCQTINQISKQARLVAALALARCSSVEAIVFRL